MWDKAKQVLGMIAPTLGAAIGGPFGGIAGQLAKEALGLPPETSDEQLAKAIVNATPDQLIAIKQADNNLAIRLKELDVDLFKAEVDDRKDSRQRAVTMNDYSPVVTGTLVFAGWFYIQYLVLNMTTIPAIGEGLLNRILGQIDAVALMYAAWLWGSSKGSRAKDELLTRKD